MKITSDRDHIMVVDDVLLPDLCEQIVAKYSSDPRRTSSLSKTKFDKPYRDGLCLTISRYADWKALDDQIHERIKAATVLYLKKYGIDVEVNDTGYTVADFVPGHNTKEHVDHIHGNSVFRLVTVILYLNEPGDGGATTFPNQGQHVQPKAGRMVMFPPFYTHPHGSDPATKDRYIVVTWLCSNPKLYDPRLGAV